MKVFSKEKYMKCMGYKNENEMREREGDFFFNLDGADVFQASSQCYAYYVRNGKCETCMVSCDWCTDVEDE